MRRDASTDVGVRKLELLLDAAGSYGAAAAEDDGIGHVLLRNVNAHDFSNDMSNTIATLI